MCALICLMLISSGYSEATEFLVEGKTAEIKLKLGNVKAGPGKAYINNDAI